ncbi:MAG: hypothetical protein ACI9L9_000743 [Marivirga sp.]|jgi:hypothetical protein
MVKKLVILLLLSYSQQLMSQDYNWWVNGQVFDSFILPHNKKVSHLIKGRPSGFELNIQKELNGTRAWEKLYNHPIVNYGLAYYDLKNESQLGELYIASTSVDLPLIKSKHTNLFFRIGAGLVYSTQPYNRETNNQNTMIGSRFTCLIQTRLTYEIKLNEQVKLTPALNITHGSNGAQSVPNSGINIITANIGISYRLLKRNEDAGGTPPPLPKKPASLFNFYLLLSSGKNTMTAQVRTPLIFFNIAAIGQKYLSPKSDLQFGIEYFHNKALEKQIATSWFNKDLTSFPDFKRAGILIGHELKAGGLGFITQLGVYIYNPSKSNMPVYQRYGITNEFTDHIIGQISLKAHTFTAEQIEFGLGWKF